MGMAIFAVILSLVLGILFYGPGIGIVIAVSIMGGFIIYKLDQVVKKLDELKDKK